MLITDDASLYRALLIPLCVFLLSIYGCVSESPDEQQGSGEDGTPVSVVEVETRNLQETTTAIGTLEAEEKVEIRPEISARIENINFEEGDTVTRGQVLVELEDEQLTQQVESRKSQLEEAKAKLKNASQTYQRQKRLYEKDLTSGQQRDNALEAYESAQARVRQLEAQLSEARDRLEDATIKAPFDGAMGEQKLDEGNYVQAGQLISTLYRMSRLKVSFTVPERFSGRVKKGQSVRTYVNSIPGDVFDGRVYFVSPSVRKQTRDLLIKAYIDNARRRLKPGMFARVELVLETYDERPVIPAKALVATREGYFVYRVEDGKAHRQPVKIGLRQPGLVEIRDGLIPGETIVESGHMSISDGSAVRMMNSNDGSQ